MNNTHYSITMLMAQESVCGLSGSFAQGPTGLQPRCWLPSFSCRGSTGEEPTSKFTWAVGKVYFLAMIWSRLPAFCWLCSLQALEGQLLPWRPHQHGHWLYPAGCRESISPRAGPSPPFKGFHLMKSGSPRTILLLFKINWFGTLVSSTKSLHLCLYLELE